MAILDGKNIATALLKRREDVQAAAEQMLLAAIRDERELTFDELEFLTNEAGFDKSKLIAEKRRLGRVVRLQAISGDAKTRGELDTALVAAEAVLSKREPELQAAIDKASTELASITKNRDTLSRRKSEVDAALASLKELVSPSVAARCAAKREMVNSTLGRELYDAQSELNEIESFLRGPNENQAYWTQLRLYDRELIAERLDGRILSYNYSEKWPAFRASCESELPSRRAKVAQLKEHFDSELAKLGSELQQYWN